MLNYEFAVSHDSVTDLPEAHSPASTANAAMQRDSHLDRSFRPAAFISGTFDDLKSIREIVRIGIMKARAAPIEPMYDSRSHEKLVDSLRRDIEQDAYFYVGVFGTRYGSLISSAQDAISYTHFEYLVASEKWKAHKPPPMAVFLPSPVGPLYDEIKRKCEESLQRLEREQGKEKRDEDERRQQEFLNLVRHPQGDSSYGKVYCWQVDSEDDLRNSVTIWILDYQHGLTLAQSQEYSHKPLRRVVFDQNKWPEQIQQVTKLCDLLKSSENTRVPGLCLFVHGLPERGQPELAARIAQPRFWDTESDPEECELLPSDPVKEREAKIWRTFHNATWYEPHDLTDTNELAKQIWAFDRPLVVILRQLQMLPGHTAAFAELWKRLYDSLVKASRERSDFRDTRLIVIATYEGADSELNDSNSCALDENLDSLTNLDFRKLLALKEMPARRR